MSLIRMVHLKTGGELLVPDGAVDRYQTQGWELKSDPKTEQANESEADSDEFLPEHESE